MTDTAHQSDAYKWDQELKEIIITIPLDEEATKKDIDIKCGTTHIQVSIKGKEVLSGEFLKNIRFESDNLIFMIEDNKLEITLDKEENTWWDSLFKNGEKIDISDIAQKKESKFEDLDDEAKHLVSKMMYQQNQKKSVNPEHEELLRKIQESEKLDLKHQKFEENVEEENVKEDENLELEDVEEVN